MNKSQILYALMIVWVGIYAGILLGVIGALLHG